MKKKLNKDAYDKLSDDFKKLYKKVGDSYVVDLEGDDDDDPDDDTAGLKKALEAEREARKAADKALKAIKDKAEQEEREKAGKTGDIAALEKSWADKLAAREVELNETILQRENSLRTILVDSKAMELATQLSNHPKLLIPHIKERLVAEFTDGVATTRILKDGKPSAMTLDDLSKEMIASKDFSAILIGSKGSGGGSGNSGNGDQFTGGDFDLKTYQNADGSVNWQKVNLASKDNPDLISQVTNSLNPPQTGE